MSVIPLTAQRLVAVAAVVAIALAMVSPAFAQPADRARCAAMGSGDCGRGALVAPCCCADADPATPAHRQLLTGCEPPSVAVPGSQGTALPVLALGAVISPAALEYRSVPRYTLFSTLLM